MNERKIIPVDCMICGHEFPILARGRVMIEGKRVLRCFVLCGSSLCNTTGGTSKTKRLAIEKWNKGDSSIE